MHYVFQFWTALLCLLVILICDINISIISRYIVQYISIWNKQNMIINYRVSCVTDNFTFLRKILDTSSRSGIVSVTLLAVAIKDDPNSLDKYLLRWLSSCSIHAASIPCLLSLNVRNTQNISACGSVFIAHVPITSIWYLLGDIEYKQTWRWWCRGCYERRKQLIYKKDTHNTHTDRDTHFITCT